jgi:predicted deacylase
VSSYDEVTRRLKALETKVQLSTLGCIAGYPVFSATINPTATDLSIWINAGTHGDEPAGVEAALTFLETSASEDFTTTRVIVTPCLNPFGYTTDQRENVDGVDINWAFKRDDVPEIALIKDLIRDQRFTAIIDLHEDWESPRYYLYEQARSRNALGHTITERVRDVCPVNDAEMIEDEIADRGVINPSMDVAKRNSGEGVPVEVFNVATDHQITSESPKGRPMNDRVRAHMTAIQVFLEAYAL